MNNSKLWYKIVMQIGRITYSGNYSHMDGGVMDGWWRDVGDDGDEDLL
jgi:hypothetical protein